MLFLDVDPSLVKPGWTPLVITILLAAAIALLMISMRRQMRKITAPRRNPWDDSEQPTAPDTEQADQSADQTSETASETTDQPHHVS